jgi:hypothetical protein
VRVREREIEIESEYRNQYNSTPTVNKLMVVVTCCKKSANVGSSDLSRPSVDCILRKLAAYFS